MGVWGEDPLVARDDELAEAAPERSVTWMQGMGAAGADGFDSGTEPPRALFREHRELQSQFMYENRNNWQSWYMADAFDRQQPVWLSAEEANRTYGIEGALDFAPDHPDGVSEEYAASLYEVRARMVARADEVARMPHVLPFHLDSMLAALAGGFVNPVNLVTVLPFGRWGALRTAMPRLAAAEQSANFAVRFGGRAAFGAIEGAGAMAAIDPFYQWARTRGGQDWHLTDSLAQLALGAVMGGTMGAVFGERTLPREDYRAPAAVDALDPVTREAAASAALVQAADGRPIDVRPIMAEGRMRAEAELNQSPTDLRYRPIKEAEVFSPSGEQLSARYAVVEIGDLVTSNTDGLAVNPEYPQLLQPRDRTRAASETQISSFGAPFQPERWGESPQADAGAPVVGSDRVVESGNGRTIFLRRAYRAGDPRAETYRAWLKREGYPIEGLKQPMLVRVVDAGRGAEARMRFAQDANKPGAATMSASELAFADAKRLSASVLDEHKGGAASAEGNAPFSRAALSALTSEAERGALIDATGLLSKSGETRLEAALMARAYDDAALVSMRFEAIDEDFKTIGGALSDAAPAMARVAMGVDAGQIVRDFDVRAALSAAVALLRQAKKDGKSVKAFLSELHAQGDMFGGGLSARTVDMLALLTEDGVRVRPRAKIAASLDAFAHVAEISPAPVLFEEAKFGYSSGFKAAAYKAGEPGLRARDAGGADGGGRGQIVDGAGAEERARTGRAQITEALQQDFTAAGLAPEQAAAAARVQANVITNLAAHYGEDPFAAFETMRPRIQRSDNAQRAALEQRIVEGEALGQGAKGAEIRERLADSDRLIERAKEMSQAFAAAAECAATHGLGAAATAGLGEMVAGNLLGASVAGVAGAVGANEQGRATRKAEFDRLEGERVASEARALAHWRQQRRRRRRCWRQ